MTVTIFNGDAGSNLYTTDGARIGCIAHFLNSSMKHLIATYTRDNKLLVGSTNFRSIKRIVEDCCRNSLNNYLSDELILIQEVEIRFGTHFMVTLSFLKSISYI